MKKHKPLTKVENQQQLHRLDLNRCRDLLDWFIRCARRHLPADMPPWVEVLAFFVNDKGSAAAHNTVFGDNGPTDVITLSYDPMPGMNTGRIGELIINVDRAVTEGDKRKRPRNWSIAHELALYLAHGVDHLTGATDDTPPGRRRMRAREMNWVRSAERRGLLQDLMQEGSPVV